LSLTTTGDPNLKALLESALKAVAPPPDLTVSQWADTYRFLPAGAAAKPGRWKTSRAEFQREPMDVITDPDVHEIVIVGPSQLLKSEVELNAIGYFMHLDPCPMMMVQPDTKNAKEFSDDRIAAMIEATPVLKERVFKRRGGSSDRKSNSFNLGFPGGYLAIASANVPASLASKPLRVILADEVDRFELSSGDEGDPLELAVRRTTNFWNYKIFKTSSPGLLAESLIIAAYKDSDQREFYVPCPYCGAMQTLKWGGPKDNFGLKWYGNDPSTAYYLCEHCGEHWTEADKLEAIRNGRWKAHAPFNGVAGFKINALYNTLGYSWEKLVREFLRIKDDPKKLQVFVNTRLAEGWEERGESVSDSALMQRRETYPAQVPRKAFVLTCFVDVQKDRLEALVQGWGKGEENWTVEHAFFRGDPDEDEPWDELESYLGHYFSHESGIRLPLSVTLIDSGYKAQRVYDFVKKMSNPRICATKGKDGWGVPVIAYPSGKRTGKDERKVDLYLIGVDEAKDAVMRRLRKKPGGPYTYHFPKREDALDEEFFKQLTAEKLVTDKDKRGFRTKYWKKIRDRNEIWDMTVGNYAAIQMLPPNWEDWEETIVPPMSESGEKQATVKPAPNTGGRKVRNKGIR
jgi:phage terminase large subunit GpA-like protein